MSNLRDIKRRIGSVKSTQKITSAMKMVSAAKLRRAQDAIGDARPYAVRMRETLSAVGASGGDATHPLLERRDEPAVLEIVVITSDRGLAGAFNSNVIKAADALIAERSKRVREDPAHDHRQEGCRLLQAQAGGSDQPLASGRRASDVPRSAADRAALDGPVRERRGRRSRAGLQRVRLDHESDSADRPAAALYASSRVGRRAEPTRKAMPASPTRSNRIRRSSSTYSFRRRSRSRSSVRSSRTRPANMRRG